MRATHEEVAANLRVPVEPVASDGKLEISAADPYGEVAAELIRATDRELEERYPGGEIHGITPAEVAGPRGVFLVARRGQQPVGCGALRPIDEATVEIKRMFVKAEARGGGIGRVLLQTLEAQAAELGYRVIRLETGEFQREAIALYQSAGYATIPRFGEYRSDPRSLCFQKRLVE